MISGTGNLGQVGEALCLPKPGTLPGALWFPVAPSSLYAALVRLAVSILTPIPWVELSETLFR